MAQNSTKDAIGDGKNISAAPVISLPKGGGAVRGIGEKFGANPVTGTGSMSVPIATSPGRSGFGPQLSLAYDSGAGNGPFGFGWSLSLPSIVRKTDKGLPRYEDASESDVFILSGSEDLVPVPTAPGAADPAGYSVQRYRPRIEGLFARIERWTAVGTGEIHWRSISRDNVTTLYGRDNNSRIFDPADPDPQHPTRIFSWLICQSHDDKGNAIEYEYVAEDSRGVDLSQANERNRSAELRGSNRYLKRVRYGNSVSRLLPGFASTAWLFEVVFDYGEGYLTSQPLDPDGRQTIRARLVGTGAWPVRPDPFSTYRSGFEVRTYRLCERVLMFHHFPDELGVDDYLVRSTELGYDRGSIASFVTSATQSGYVAWPDAANPTDLFLQRSLPPVELEYSKAALSSEVRELDPDSVENLPTGLDDSRYQWVDLNGEGLSGILSEQGDAWFYKRNLGGGRFGPVERVGSMPAAAHLAAGGQQLLDLSGNGQLDLAEFAGATPGFYERTTDERWTSFTPFPSLPRVDWSDPNLRFVDLTGDGHADLLITEDCAFRWHPSLAENGFGAEERTVQPVDEELGPRLVFADGTQSIYLADFSGDGLSDLVRIRNGEVSYWPNVGYGRFGARVSMDDAPTFDYPDLFDQQQIRLADIDGSGLTDIIYLQRGRVSIYRNLSGNRWSDREMLTNFPAVDDLSSVVVADLLGTGTACLVWSSPLPGDAQRPMRYIELMAEGKPHLLISAKNNLGAETRVVYAASTRFQSEDRLAGRPWITRLPFPVHVVERVETWDWISRNRFVSRYSYHHGHFDGVEREFRGFGMIEQRDTEEIAALGTTGYFPVGDNVDPASHVPPVLTKTWFHTGVYVGGDRVSNYFAGLTDAEDRGEYYREPAWRDDDVEARKRLLDDTILPDALTVEEEREACRSLKGAMLRQEVYALDGSAREREPYTVTEQNFTIRCLHRREDSRNAVFFTHAREAISYHYERNPTDPRVSHALTLEVDEYGDVLRSLAVGYGRRQSPLAEARDRDKQTTALITCSENVFTNEIDDAQHPDDYRTPLPAETRTYELTGFSAANNAERFSFNEWTSSPPDLLASAQEIPYAQQADNVTRQRRLIEQIRTLYRRNDLASLSPLGTVESRAMPGESYKLAFSASLAKLTFVDSGKLTQSDLDTALAGGAYVHSEGDGDWWIPSGRMFYSGAANQTAAQELLTGGEHFFLPRRYRDPFGQDVVVTYDGPTDPTARRYDLMVTATRDALGNTVRAGHDYRVLQPRFMTDPNDNRTAAEFDALGMVAATAAMGKPLPAPVEGDSLIGIVPDLTQATIDAFHDSADPHVPAVALLQGATTRTVYDIGRFQRTQRANPQDTTRWLPPCAASVGRETHLNDPLPPQGLEIQISFCYSDGFGHEVQKKIQAEPEMIASVPGPPRWVGSGWTIFNNKGKPVRQYEPFFSPSHRYEFGVQVGVSAVQFYDPVDRVVATLGPNHTYGKVVFDPWEQTTYDVHDTVAPDGVQTGDPRTDPDIAGYVREYFAIQPANWATWYAQRMGNPAGDAERDAAEKSAEHANTPGVAHVDALGRPFLTLAHNRYRRAGLVVDEKNATRIELDIEGNQREVRDAKDRVMMRYDYDMLGTSVHQASMEAGERWMLADVAGQPILAWDSRGFERRFTYDELRRATHLYVIENGSERLAERTVYGEGQGTAANHRARAYQVFDGAGTLTNVAYDFKGNLLAGQRKLLSGYESDVDWLQNPLATDGTFSSATTYDALNRPQTVTSPDGSIHRPTFNEANLLEKVEVNLRGAVAPTVFVKNIDHDAKGQRTRIEYGSGAITTYEYDPLTFRLIHLRTTRPSNADVTASQLFQDIAVVQDLSYTYDAVGNITRITDAALRTVFNGGQRIDPVAGYTYNALYQLIEATGREHITQAPFDFTPSNRIYRDHPFVGASANPNDLQALRLYTQRYEYDAVGNFEMQRHVANAGSWTRSYAYDEASLIEAGKQSNRLSNTTVGNGLNRVELYTYDAHGNMTLMPHLSLMTWDFNNQLHQLELGGGGKAFYIYDAAGQRTRKVITTQSGVRTKERIYLGGFEIYREYGGNGNSIALERESLHVQDGSQRIVLVDTQTIANGSSVVAATPLQRYQLGNHLGSASVELDEAGALVSYEEFHPYGTTSFQAGRSAAEVRARRYRYTSMERDDETGLGYHGARYYAPWVGRWTSTDPSGPADGLNLYEYCRNNPVNLRDPNGHASQPSTFAEHVDFIKRASVAFAGRTNQLAVESALGIITGPINLFKELGQEGPSTIWTRDQIQRHSDRWIEGIKAPWEHIAEGYKTSNPELLGAGLAEAEWQVAMTSVQIAGVVEAASSLSSHPVGTPVSSRVTPASPPIQKPVVEPVKPLTKPVTPLAEPVTPVTEPVKPPASQPTPPAQKLLPAGRTTSRTQKQVSRQRGTGNDRGGAHNKHMEELYGGKAPAEETRRGTSIADAKDANSGSVDLRYEGKNYRQFRGVKGQKGGTLQQVELTDRLAQQADKYYLWIKAGKRAGLERHIQYDFIGAEPSPAFRAYLQKRGLSVHITTR